MAAPSPLNKLCKARAEGRQARLWGGAGRGGAGGKGSMGKLCRGRQGPYSSWLAGRWLNSVPEAEDRGPSPLLSSHPGPAWAPGSRLDEFLLKPVGWAPLVPKPL